MHARLLAVSLLLPPSERGGVFALWGGSPAVSIRSVLSPYGGRLSPSTTPKRHDIPNPKVLHNLQQELDARPVPWPYWQVIAILHRSEGERIHPLWDNVPRKKFCKGPPSSQLLLSPWGHGIVMPLCPDGTLHSGGLHPKALEGQVL